MVKSESPVALAARRRSIRRHWLAVALVGGSGIAAIALTFVPWTHTRDHQTVSGWQLYRRSGATFEVYDDNIDLSVGEEDPTEGLTGITTLVAGALLVGGASILALSFDREARVDYGFVAYTRWCANTVRVLGGLAIAFLLATSISHLAVGLNTSGLAALGLAVLASAGVYGIAVPMRRG